MKAVNKFYCTLLLFVFYIVSCNAGPGQKEKSYSKSKESDSIVTGAMQPDVYLPLLKGKKVAVLANQTSMISGEHIVDFLIRRGVNVVKVFAPEHGFRGEAGPGDIVKSGLDDLTGLPVLSLYGSKKRPAKEDLEKVDIVIFDIQDVGARFYTYISTLHYMMEACSENNVGVMVFDRPNPNGFCVDGPVLEPEFSSFVGVAAIPICHGLTVAEYALMINGEHWLRNNDKCALQIVKMKNYDHSMNYNLPVRPSPNLPDMTSIYLYPSLCLFEGTNVSVGRGTDRPFKIIGFPGYSQGEIEFTPVEIEGVIKNPPYMNIKCKGIDLSQEYKNILSKKQLNLSWLIEMYKAFPDKEKFFNNFFDKLAGTDKLRLQIINGNTEAQIRDSWQPKLDNYKSIRKKYLIYAD